MTSGEAQQQAHTWVDTDRVDRYVKRDMHRVGGFLVKLDAQLFVSLLATQAALGVSGGLVEIGVHHGRSFFLMAMCRQAGERSLAVDLFEDDEKYSDPEGLGRAGHFEQNREWLGVALSDAEVYQGSSLELPPEEISRRVGPVRFFSVDGGHLYHEVESDLRLAQETLHDEGVVVIDDFANAYWPEVTFATYDWLRGGAAELVPFATTQVKLYVCHRRHAARYRDAIRNDATLAPSLAPEVSFLGDEVVALKRSVRTKAVDALSSRVYAAERSLGPDGVSGVLDRLPWRRT